MTRRKQTDKQRQATAINRNALEQQWNDGDIVLGRRLLTELTDTDKCRYLDRFARADTDALIPMMIVERIATLTAQGIASNKAIQQIVNVEYAESDFDISERQAARYWQNRSALRFPGD